MRSNGAPAQQQDGGEESNISRVDESEIPLFNASDVKARMTILVFNNLIFKIDS